MLIKLAETQLSGILSYCRQIFITRRAHSLSLLFATGLGLSVIVAGCSPTATTTDTATKPTTPTNSAAPAKSVTVNIGYQKSATVLNALKTKGDLEKALAASKSSVKFVEFPAGPPLLDRNTCNQYPRRPWQSYWATSKHC
ncbi:MAG: hypothetical protein QQW96_21020 [Tychonema bourrellyi B0820]|uniref:Uncharacterized protein n=1 Tax=Tychonema bourrellyi FEM_GT703 TaxID=2040638 RepID=A0A2G4EVU7_9CYAN|nr:hypothetical protein [Tychonema bourrellyi]MDQ2100118.1 hypothetical protein [Tychonema bourrellyi B0820]PHX53307.1 hypothetical protein CP500_022185 [Tychonema bourrellyi FEM_GT703]